MAQRTNTRLIEDLKALLLEGHAETQQSIQLALEKKGYTITQSKVSRLLRKIGAIKSKNEDGQIVYQLPKEPPPPTTTNQLASLIIDIDAKETIIMINTSPGSAQLIARMVDYHKKQLNVLGTIAGDDTVFVVPRSVEQIETVLNSIQAILLV